jgi:U2 small nuclear ribonucleoprotein A'
VIENLGASLDQFDTIDLSDNDIRKLEGFPLLHRLKMLLINNNRICRVATDLHDSIPALQWLVLTNNDLEELGDLDGLASLKNLTHLSLLLNPVIHKPHYRSYVIFKIPQLQMLDFQRIRLKERQRANEIFASADGKEILKRASKRNKTFVPGEVVTPGAPKKPIGPSAEEIAAIRMAIANAKSLEEVRQLELQLQSGQLPVTQAKGPLQGKQNGQIVEEDEDDEEGEQEQMQT